MIGTKIIKASHGQTSEGRNYGEQLKGTSGSQFRTKPKPQQKCMAGVTPNCGYSFCRCVGKRTTQNAAQSSNETRQQATYMKNTKQTETRTEIHSQAPQRLFCVERFLLLPLAPTPCAAFVVPNNSPREEVYSRRTTARPPTLAGASHGTGPRGSSRRCPGPTCPPRPARGSGTCASARRPRRGAVLSCLCAEVIATYWCLF